MMIIGWLRKIRHSRKSPFKIKETAVKLFFYLDKILLFQEFQTIENVVNRFYFFT